jgi:hypothetical protein
MSEQGLWLATLNVVINPNGRRMKPTLPDRSSPRCPTITPLSLMASGSVFWFGTWKNVCPTAVKPANRTWETVNIVVKKRERMRYLLVLERGDIVNSTSNLP